MNYDRAHVRNFFAALTPDSRPCSVGICPLMVVYPSMRRMADATRADPELVRELDRYYKLRHTIAQGQPPWGHFTVAEILHVIDTMP